jgi:hypothetical protein
MCWEIRQRAEGRWQKGRMKVEDRFLREKGNN